MEIADLALELIDKSSDVLVKSNVRKSTNSFATISTTRFKATSDNYFYPRRSNGENDFL
jgi:hypothetical protein